MNVDEEFKKWLESLDEVKRKEVEQRLSGMSDKEREFAKVFAVVVKTFEDYEKKRREAILGAVNKEELEKVNKEDLVVALHDVIWQACGDGEGNVDSRALSSYADAMRLLARLGVLDVQWECGRRVIGKLKGVDV